MAGYWSDVIAFACIVILVCQVAALSARLDKLEREKHK